MAGYEPIDATSIDRGVDSGHALREDLRGVRIGIVREFDIAALGSDRDTVYRAAYGDSKTGAELVEDRCRPPNTA